MSTKAETEESKFIQQLIDKSPFYRQLEKAGVRVSDLIHMFLSALTTAFATGAIAGRNAEIDTLDELLLYHDAIITDSLAVMLDCSNNVHKRSQQ